MNGKFGLGLVLLALIAAGSQGVSAKEKRKAADLDAWVGQWSAGPEQAISITADGNGLHVDASASFGASDPERVERGAVNVGAFGGRVPATWIVGGKVQFASSGEEIIPVEAADDYDCVVSMERVGEELRVEDNGMCGGFNVSFNGVYRR